MEEYAMVDHKRLRRGYTTGTCGAAAAKAAARLALGLAKTVEAVEILTPKGTVLQLSVRTDHQEPGAACCAVQKDSGDDPDITNGAWICASVSLRPDEEGRIFLEAGVGVGRVTKPGLACAVGQPAINPVPRRMIEEQVRQAAEEAGYEGGLAVTISIPDGERLAQKTYNPRLGIVGGLSILGTSGIVEPMSEKALVDTIKVEMNQQKASGAKYLLLTPGNYGETFLKSHEDLERIYTVKCSNFLGEALDYAVELGFEGVLLTAHIGKLVKVAGGIMNTHSRYGDARMEILAAHGARLGADRRTVTALMECVTTDEAIQVLGDLKEKTLESILERVDYHIKQRTREALLTGAVMFSNVHGYLGQTAGAEELIRLMAAQG